MSKRQEKHSFWVPLWKSHPTLSYHLLKTTNIPVSLSLFLRWLPTKNKRTRISKKKNSRNLILHFSINYLFYLHFKHRILIILNSPRVSSLLLDDGVSWDRMKNSHFILQFHREKKESERKVFRVKKKSVRNFLVFFKRYNVPLKDMKIVFIGKILRSITTDTQTMRYDIWYEKFFRFGRMRMRDGWMEAGKNIKGEGEG